MAKISFTKLGLKANQDIKTLLWNGQEIEVKQYLSISDKLDIITNVVNLSHDEENNFSNPVRVDVLTHLHILMTYTNINFTDKQKEDIVKLYDLVKGSGLLDQVIALIPKEEYSSLINSIETTIESVYKYQNSIMGILDTIKQDYSNLNLDATEIQKKLNDPENMALLKSILAELG